MCSSWLPGEPFLVERKVQEQEKEENRRSRSRNTPAAMNLPERFIELVYHDGGEVKPSEGHYAGGGWTGQQVNRGTQGWIKVVEEQRSREGDLSFPPKQPSSASEPRWDSKLMSSSTKGSKSSLCCLMNWTTEDLGGEEGGGAGGGREAEERCN